jgi:hypothetical protein
MPSFLPNQTLTGSFHYAPHTLQYAGLDYFNPQPVTPNGISTRLRARSPTGWRSAAGLQSTVSSRVVSSDITAQGTADMVLTPTGNLGNYFGQESRRANRFEWIEEWTPRTLHFAGEHMLKFGSVLGHSENVGEFDARPVLIDDASGHLLQQINFSGAGAYDLSDWSRRRLPRTTGCSILIWRLTPAATRSPDDHLYHARRSARTGFEWTPDMGKTVVRGGIGVFYDSVPLDVYAFNSYPEQTITTYNSSGASRSGRRCNTSISRRRRRNRIFRLSIVRRRAVISLPTAWPGTWLWSAR